MIGDIVCGEKRHELEIALQNVCDDSNGLYGLAIMHKLHTKMSNIS